MARPVIHWEIGIPGICAFAMFSDPEGNVIGLMSETRDQLVQ